MTRGLSSSGDVQWLRKIFLAVQADVVPIQASHLPQARIEEMYRSTCVKLGELEKLKVQLDRNLPMPVSSVFFFC